MWIIGFFLDLIFGGAVRFTALCLLIYVLSLAETVILRYQRPEDKLSKLTSFNFEENDVKMNYAKAKFIFSATMGILYAFLESLLFLFRSKAIEVVNNAGIIESPSKSFVLFIVLALLTLLRDRYEKQINKKFQ